MWSFILSQFGPWILGAGGVLLGVVLAYFRGRSTGKKLERAKQTEGQLKLREQYDEVDSRPHDPGSAYDSLLARSRKR